MNSQAVFAMAMASRNNEPKVFGWQKAAQIIKERKPQKAIAGLEEDMFWTAGTIYEDGKPILDCYTYLLSTWATPILKIDGEAIDCYVMKSQTEYNEDTKWPSEALDILGGE